MQLRPEAEGEEGEVEEGAEASITEEATAKEVMSHFYCSSYASRPD